MTIRSKQVIDRVPVRNNGYSALEGLAMNAGGDFVIVSDHLTTDSGGAVSTQLQTFDLRLAPQGEPVQVSGTADSFVGVGIDAAGNVALLQSAPAGATVSRFTADGTALGTSTIDAARPAGLAVAGSGEFAVVWNETDSVDLFGSGQSASTARKRLQYFKPDGSADGDPITVDSGLAQINYTPSSLAIDAGGATVAIWPTLFPDYSLQLVGRTVSAP
jgi:hypothetical protein